MSAIVKKIAVAMENGEYDFDGTQDKVVRNCVIKEIQIQTWAFITWYYLHRQIMFRFESTLLLPVSTSSC